MVVVLINNCNKDKTIMKRNTAKKDLKFQDQDTHRINLTQNPVI